MRDCWRDTRTRRGEGPSTVESFVHVDFHVGVCCRRLQVLPRHHFHPCCCFGLSQILAWFCNATVKESVESCVRNNRGKLELGRRWDDGGHANKRMSELLHGCVFPGDWGRDAVHYCVFSFVKKKSSLSGRGERGIKKWQFQQKFPPVMFFFRKRLQLDLTTLCSTDSLTIAYYTQSLHQINMEIKNMDIKTHAAPILKYCIWNVFVLNVIFVNVNVLSKRITESHKCVSKFRKTNMQIFNYTLNLICFLATWYWMM